MPKLHDQSQKEIDWPDDWPQPTKGASAAPLAGAVEYEALRADIKRRGLKDKIRFTPDGKLSEGRNRYRALRDLGWTHERITEEASETLPASDLDGALSNIMRVNRTKLGLVGSYLIAHERALGRLLKDRAEGGKSGTAGRVAAAIGCSPNIITRALDELERYEGNGMSRREALDYIAGDLGHRAGFPAPEVHVIDTPFGFQTTSTTQTGAVAGEDDTEEVRDVPSRETPHHENGSTKRDRRVKVTPEIEEAVLASLAEGSSQREAAQLHGIHESTVRRITKAAKPKPDKDREDAPTPRPQLRKLNTDPVAAKLLKMWERYGGKEITPDLFYKLVAEAMGLSNLTTAAVVKDIRPDLPIG